MSSAHTIYGENADEISGMAVRASARALNRFSEKTLRRACGAHNTVHLS